MNGVRALLVVIFVVLGGYTVVVVANHGMGLLPVFFGDRAKLAWPGRFNLDLMFMLALSALWVAWRHRFSGPGLALSVCAFLVGALFLSIYLFVASLRAGGDGSVLVLGDRAAVA